MDYNTQLNGKICLPELIPKMFSIFHFYFLFRIVDFCSPFFLRFYYIYHMHQNTEICLGIQFLKKSFCLVWNSVMKNITTEYSKPFQHSFPKVSMYIDLFSFRAASQHTHCCSVHIGLSPASPMIIARCNLSLMLFCLTKQKKHLPCNMYLVYIFHLKIKISFIFFRVVYHI